MNMRSPDADITGLIRAWREDQPGALNRLMEAAYPSMKNIAIERLRNERAGHTLQCTALVNEACLRLIRHPNGREWKDRTHFFAFAARVMRGILVDYGRARRTAKRDPGQLRVALYSRPGESAMDADVVDLNDALDDLEKLDAVQSRVVELRYFGGLSIEEAAEALDLSSSTVKRDWLLAKTWLRRRLLEGRAAIDQ
jgi:RNA polymerase sigma factor (TIGR02999 family)